MSNAPVPRTDDDLTTATDAYVFGCPLVLMDVTEKTQTNTVQAGNELAPVNQFCHHQSLPNPESKTVVRLNLDTLYSIAWLDLSTEPQVLQIPDMADRYWLMQIMDVWTNTVHDPSKTTTHDAGQQGPYTFVLTGPNWPGGTLPEDAVQLSMPTDTVWIVGRTELFDDDDLSNVTTIQGEMRLQPLSSWPDPYPLPDGSVDPLIDMSTAPATQVLDMDGTTFFNRLRELLKTTETTPDDAPMMAELATIGLGPDATGDLPSTDVLDQAVAAGQTHITTHTASAPVNGWSFDTTGVGTYGTDYDQRAYIAWTALGANLPKDALYPSIVDSGVDQYGQAQPGYTLTFAPGQEPPVDAFWSLTAYDVDGFLMENDTDVYSIGHRKPTPDETADGIVLAIQNEQPAYVPADETNPNWLPVPAGAPFSLTLRLYSPKDSAISGPWTPPPLVPGDTSLKIASDAYVYGYPLMLMALTEVTQTNTATADDKVAPINQFCHHRTLPDPADKSVVRLNMDTLYSIAWLDLSAEPQVLKIPEMADNRYWLMQIMDAWSNTVHDPSKTSPLYDTAQDGYYTYVLTGPNWQGTLPEGMVALAMPTDTVWILGRTELRALTDEEYGTVNAIQDSMVLQPLSTWPNPYTPPAGFFDQFTDMVTAPADQIAALDGPTFFTQLCALLKTTPVPAADQPALDRFATVGIYPGATFTDADAPLLDQAADNAKAFLPNYRDPSNANVNHWFWSTEMGTYGTDYNQRAYVALTGLGANLPQDAIYQNTIAQAADGDDNSIRYTLHLPALPTVEAFWSVTAYGADSFPVENDAKIYSLGHQIPPGQQTPLKANLDGSYDIAVQYGDPSPDPDPENPSLNWLPIPRRGEFSLTLRQHVPRTDPIWAPPTLTPLTPSSGE